MTRYTRARGSKASNERLPNDPTPWNVMKQQLRDKLAPASDEKELLQDRRKRLPENPSSGSSAPRERICNDSWAEFQETEEKMPVERSTDGKKGRKRRGTSAAVDSKGKTEDSGARAEPEENGPADVAPISVDGVEMANKDQRHGTFTKRQKRNIVKRKKKMNEGVDSELRENNRDNDNVDDVEKGRTNERLGRNFSNDCSSKLFDNKSNKPRIVPGRRQDREMKFAGKNGNAGKKRKPAKIRDDSGEHKRRKPEAAGPLKITINGVDLEIVKYDGFPVKKEDAERLKELRRAMIMKGIPKGEVDATMKLERRRAEKALARAKKSVCFHCRKAGHNLSDCPELSSEHAATGICFKCGSTEHTHFECKVSKASEYRYATCFICREQGHIAKQCPDNPKGVYPQGGACKICGDVTHLKKDCPDLVKEKEENAVTVETIGDGNLEALEEARLSKRKLQPNNEKTSKQKVVKF